MNKEIKYRHTLPLFEMYANRASINKNLISMTDLYGEHIEWLPCFSQDDILIIRKDLLFGCYCQSIPITANSVDELLQLEKNTGYNHTLS